MNHVQEKDKMEVYDFKLTFRSEKKITPCREINDDLIYF